MTIKSLNQVISTVPELSVTAEYQGRITQRM